MDTTDPDIKFNNEGICNYCLKYDLNIKKYVYGNEKGGKRLRNLIKEIKLRGKHKEYDCVIGVSGGVDSTYVAYLVKKLGLNPIAVHLDNGWNSEIAVRNIHNSLSKLDISLHTHVLKWDEFKDLQIAFLKASTPDSEIPSDHAIQSLMYHVASKYRINYIINGLNYRTESHLPKSWSRGHWDWKYINSIHKEYGRKNYLIIPI